jgi:hypothetical protein
MSAAFRRLTAIFVVCAGAVLLVTTTSSAVGPRKVHHSEELVFKSAVETLIYHSECRSFDDLQDMLKALEARPMELEAAGHAAMREWGVYSRFARRLSRVHAPDFWRHDWREWKRWNRRVVGRLHSGAHRLLADDWPSFEKMRAADAKAAHNLGMGVARCTWTSAAERTCLCG